MAMVEATRGIEGAIDQSTPGLPLFYFEDGCTEALQSMGPQTMIVIVCDRPE
jgi:hypothetical protein